MTNKTFCIDQTKSLEELYALKVVTEMRKIVILMNFHDFQAKPLILVDFDDFLHF